MRPFISRKAMKVVPVMELEQDIPKTLGFYLYQ